MPTSVPNGTITFPGLFGDFAIKPSEGFTVLGLPIHWYGAIIALGFVLAYLYVNKYRKHTGLGSDDYFDYLLWAIPSAIVGARLYYVVFNLSLYKDSFWDIFKTWQGGMAIYGGVIGAAIALILVARHKKMPYLMLLDTAAPGLLIGQAIGRWGNFINRECFGGETKAFIRMGLTNSAGTTIYVHPVFLYESLWNLLGLLLIHIYTKKVGRKYDGQIFAFYIAWYGFARMIIEGMRTDSLYFMQTNIRVSQVLAGLCFVAGLFILCYNLSKKHSPEKLYVNQISVESSDEAAESEESEEV